MRTLFLMMFLMLTAPSGRALGSGVPGIEDAQQQQEEGGLFVPEAGTGNKVQVSGWDELVLTADEFNDLVATEEMGVEKGEILDNLALYMRDKQIGSVTIHGGVGENYPLRNQETTSDTSSSNDSSQHNDGGHLRRLNHVCQMTVINSCYARTTSGVQDNQCIFSDLKAMYAATTLDETSGPSSKNLDWSMQTGLTSNLSTDMFYSIQMDYVVWDATLLVNNQPQDHFAKIFYPTQFVGPNSW